MTEPTETATPAPTVETVEAMVRAQMATALGGRRGMVEAAIPGVLFTVIWLFTKDLRLSLVVGGTGVVGALVVRLVQRGTVQYVFNAAFSIGIGYLFVRLAAHWGGTESEQALAYFAPGIIFSLVYSILLIGSIVAGWPMIGFMLGSVTGDPTAWHADKQVVRLCSRLTWVLLAPGAIGVILQGPVWLLGWSGAMDADTAVLVIGILRLGLGWALRLASWAAMVWLLARNATPVSAIEGEPFETVAAQPPQGPPETA